ncbi:MAG: protein kinase [Mycobacteriaceae bacterium]|nr:protein kinase [Mycobacteriaceae bacterium]
MDGTPFGRYRLVELLGRGGMGEVWRAFDPDMNRVVALKVLPPNFADDKVFQERFRREARSAAGLDEPHVVPIYEFGEIEGRLYVTMRLIHGQDLQVLLEGGPLQPARAVGIVEQIAFALDAAHGIGLVHRDVKPSNILVADHDFAYLIDFGIARAAGETGLTSAGSTVGTWAYMAPERFRTGVADASADTYALTCVLYQSLTGELPFPATSLEQIAVAHMMQPPPKPSLLRHEVPATMDEVIATGMAKEPDQRYSTTKQLAWAARGALSAPIPYQAAAFFPDQARTRAAPTVGVGYARPGGDPAFSSRVAPKRGVRDRVVPLLMIFVALVAIAVLVGWPLPYGYGFRAKSLVPCILAVIFAVLAVAFVRVGAFGLMACSAVGVVLGLMGYTREKNLADHARQLWPGEDSYWYAEVARDHNQNAMMCLGISVLFVVIGILAVYMVIRAARQRRAFGG